MLDKMFQLDVLVICYILCMRNAIKFFFSFFISHNLSFPLINALFYVDIDQSFHKGKSKIVRNEKQKKNLNGISYTKNIANS